MAEPAKAVMLKLRTLGWTWMSVASKQITCGSSQHAALFCECCRPCQPTQDTSSAAPCMPESVAEGMPTIARSWHHVLTIVCLIHTLTAVTAQSQSQTTTYWWPIDATMPAKQWFTPGQVELQRLCGTLLQAHRSSHFDIEVDTFDQQWLSAQPLLFLSTVNPVTRKPVSTILWASYSHEVSIDGTNKSSAVLVSNIFDFQPQLPANVSACYDAYDGQLVSLTGMLADRSVHSSLIAGNPIGIIVIDLVTRDRFRINGLLVQGWSTESQSMVMQVTKSYNFCPKYVQSRAMLKSLHPMWQSSQHAQQVVEQGGQPRASEQTKAASDDSKEDNQALSSSGSNTQLPPHIVDWIVNANEMYLGSANPDHPNAEVGYNGGRAGFLRVWNRNTILWPDHIGNPFHSVLGNSLTHPSATMFLVNYETSQALVLDGQMQVHFPVTSPTMDGCKKFVTFEVERYRVLDSYVPYQGQLRDASSHNPQLRDVPATDLITTDLKQRHSIAADADVETLLDSRQKREEGQRAQKEASLQSHAAITGGRLTGDCDLTVINIINETWVDPQTQHSSILTFELQVPEPQSNYLQWSSGQYATFAFPNGLQRSWTISSPGPRHTYLDHHTVRADSICISVRRHDAGQMSRYLHDELHVGSKLRLTGIEGTFTLARAVDAAVPAKMTDEPHIIKLLLIGAGIGCTPIIAYINDIAARSKQATSRTTFDIIVVHAESHLHNMPFTSLLSDAFDQHVISQLLLVFPAKTTYAAHQVKPRKSSSNIAPLLLQQIRNGQVPVSPERLSADFLRQHVSDMSKRLAFICGPESFMTHTKQLLLKLGIQSQNVYAEDYSY